jgi:cyclase
MVNYGHTDTAGGKNAMKERAVQQTENFTLFELAGGVYAAIEKGRSAGSNAGIVDLGNAAVVFDAFVNVDAADDLKRLCRELTGKEAAYVINSHSHADHIVGNARFPGATVVSSRDARDAIEKAKPEFDAERHAYPEEIAKLETALLSAEAEAESKDIRNALFFLRNLIKPGVEMRVPDMAFTGELTLRGTARTLRLISVDIAHTKGDVLAYLPEDGIWFMGDTLFQHAHPLLGQGDPERLKETLRFVLGLPAGRYVPGHGQLAGREDILLEIRYIDELLELVRRKRGEPGDYSPSDLSPAFRDWDGLCFPGNVRFLLGRQNAEGTKSA